MDNVESNSNVTNYANKYFLKFCLSRTKLGWAINDFHVRAMIKSNAKLWKFLHGKSGKNLKCVVTLNDINYKLESPITSF